MSFEYGDAYSEGFRYKTRYFTRLLGIVVFILLVVYPFIEMLGLIWN